MVIFRENDPEAIGALETPWRVDTLAQVRTGKIKATFSTREPSAIYKQIRTGAVKVTTLGCEGDEHAFEFHGGPEKALLQYSTQHYARWKQELPQSDHLFIPGAFGENLVAVHANERNVCIGDVVQIGPVIAQVTGPRQPCYKLNHRFQVKDMSQRSQDLSRTGWFYRILKEGTIQAGDEMVLVERPNPEWTIARIQYYLYHDMRNEESMQRILEIKELGLEMRGIFTNRLKKQFENQAGRLLGAPGKALTTWKDYKILEKTRETPRIYSLVLEAVTPSEVPTIAIPGCHVRVRLGKLTRTYSVVTGDSNRFQLAIALSKASRGGSQYVHEKLRPNDVIQTGPITPSFPLADEADHHVFLAGGIGITAFIASAQHCQRLGTSYHLHYLVRSADDIALKLLLAEFGSNITIYDKSANKPFDTKAVLGKVNDQAHVYCCGPQRLQESVSATAAELGIQSHNLHFEAFEAATSGDPFTAQLADSDISVDVEENQTLLDVLREAGFDIPSSCEAGNCGTCKVGVQRGQIEHRGTGLPEAEKCSAMLSCVSRGVGIVVLEL
ncbi:pyruvate kinase-like protein [Aspergillus heterothallicus]